MASSNVPNSKSPVCDRTLATVHDCIHNIDRYKAFISNIMVIDLYSYDAVFCTMVCLTKVARTKRLISQPLIINIVTKTPMSLDFNAI